MADDTIFVLHRAMTVRRDFDRPAVTATKGYGFPDNPVRDKDSPVPFSIVRELSESEAHEAASKLKADVDRRVEELRLKAAVDRRVEELRRQQKAKG